MKNGKNWIRGLMASETRALIVGAGLLIAGAFLLVSGIVDFDVALMLAGSVLTVVSIYVTATAFIRYQWDTFVESIRQMHDMGKIATDDYLAELERRKNDKS